MFLLPPCFGIAEVTHAGLVQELGEKFLGGNVFKLELAGLGRFEQRLLIGVFELREGLAVEMLCAVSVDPLDSHAQNIPHRQPALIAELRCGLDERTLHVPNIAAGVGRLHVTVDELGHAGLQRAGANIVRGNQSIAGRQDESPLGGVEKSRLVVALGRTCVRGFIGLARATGETDGRDGNQASNS